VSGLPTGMVTFLFTGLESSSQLRTEHPRPMPAALPRLDALLRAAVQASGGRVVKGTGDRLLCSFAAASYAVAPALAAQQLLQAEDWVC
jgi:class 3 adenylate cyclase